MPRHGWEEDYLGLVFRCELGEVEDVRMLVREGVDVNWHPPDEPSALCKIAKEGNAVVAKELIGMGADVASVDLFEVRNPSVLALLFHHGANAGTAGEDGWSLLHIACTLGNEEVAICLLDHGADWFGQDRDGFTAVQVARQMHPGLADRLESYWQEKALLGATVEVQQGSPRRRF